MTMKRTPPDTPSADLGQAAQHNVQAFGQAMGEAWRSMSGLSLPMDAMGKLQADYLQQAASLWNNALTSFQQDGSAPAPVGDKRFAAEAWAKNPVAAMAAQAYLLNARTLMQMAESVQADAKTKARIRFAVQQWVDAASPANCLATNAEALAKALETRGESITAGLQHLWKDIEQGHMSQTDESVFEVGKNVATSEGAVVFENPFFQLIEYKPLTAKVHAVPMLFVPPCINKYYILDLQPENSVIRYTVEQGHRTFVVSWRNPDAAM
ncbi:MAG: class I poly(R)-hydroxyalkanoic acid synthase, partial [Burkholderiales bacterium PBB5]